MRIANGLRARASRWRCEYLPRSVRCHPSPRRVRVRTLQQPPSAREGECGSCCCDRRARHRHRAEIPRKRVDVARRRADREAAKKTVSSNSIYRDVTTVQASSRNSPGGCGVRHRGCRSPRRAGATGNPATPGSGRPETVTAKGRTWRPDAASHHGTGRKSERRGRVVRQPAYGGVPGDRSVLLQYCGGKGGVKLG